MDGPGLIQRIPPVPAICIYHTFTIRYTFTIIGCPCLGPDTSLSFNICAEILKTKTHHITFCFGPILSALCHSSHLPYSLAMG